MATDLSGLIQDRADFTFLAVETEVRAIVRRAVARFARQISAEDAGSLELTLAEVLNNVVEHSYGGHTAGRVHLRLARKGDILFCKVEDFGCPMPGLEPPKGRLSDLPADIADLPEGGWGWALIRAMTTDLEYRREADVNRLSFRMPLSPVGTSSPV